MFYPAEARNSAGNLSSKALIMVKAMPYRFRNFPNTWITQAGRSMSHGYWLCLGQC